MNAEDPPSVALRRGAEAATLEIAAAVAMLSRVQVGRSNTNATGAAAYGLVGALIGGLGGLVMAFLGGAVPILAAILAIATMTVVSGGIHLDGLADTADALMAPDPARAEAARKDPAIGSGGAAALILVLAAQVAALASLAADASPVIAGLACVAAGAASRTIPVVAVLMRGRMARRGGLGTWFADRVSGMDAAAAITTTVLVAGLTGALAGSVALAIGVSIGFGLGVASAAVLLRARGQLDGDLMGAVVELGLTATLGAAAVAMAVHWPLR
jgi:adenosylcobinamide-GDP ribazoletransferase